MDKQLQQILDNLPEDEPRSHLEPYREVILRWRRQGRSYRRICQILTDECRVKVAYGPLYRFIQRRSKPRKAPPELQPEPAAPARPRTQRSPEEIAAMREAASAANYQPVFQREEDLRPLFVYDPDRPLTNRPIRKDK
jgi:hypothetical protein